MRTYIEVAWILSTGIGLILFLIEIVILIWLKFIALRQNDSCSKTPSNSTAVDKSCNQVEYHNGKLVLVYSM